jgi:hypothetical protein
LAGAMLVPICSNAAFAFNAKQKAKRKTKKPLFLLLFSITVLVFFRFVRNSSQRLCLRNVLESISAFQFSHKVIKMICKTHACLP